MPALQRRQAGSDECVAIERWDSGELAGLEILSLHDARQKYGWILSHGADLVVRVETLEIVFKTVQARPERGAPGVTSYMQRQRPRQK